MSESSAGEVVESLGATCTIPGATPISSDPTGCVGMLATISGRVPRSVVLEERHSLGRPGVPEGDRLGFIVVYAASDAATLSFTNVRLKSRQLGRSEE